MTLLLYVVVGRAAAKRGEIDKKKWLLTRHKFNIDAESTFWLREPKNNGYRVSKVVNHRVGDKKLLVSYEGDSDMEIPSSAGGCKPGSGRGFWCKQTDALLPFRRQFAALLRQKKKRSEAAATRLRHKMTFRISAAVIEIW